MERRIRSAQPLLKERIFDRKAPDKSNGLLQARVHQLVGRCMATRGRGPAVPHTWDEKVESGKLGWLAVAATLYGASAHSLFTPREQRSNGHYGRNTSRPLELLIAIASYSALESILSQA